MKKYIIVILTACALISAAHATRVLEILEKSYELALADVSVPQSVNGTIGFKACSNCVREYMTVAGSTTYYIGGQAVSLALFTAEVNRIRLVSSTAARTMVMLHYDPETEVATRVRVRTL